MTYTNSTRQRLAINNSLLVLSSLISLFLLLEIGLRFAGYNPFGEFFTPDGRAVLIRPSNDPLRIFEATPNAQAFGWGTEISINSYGFRSPELLQNKPAHLQRIAVIGDSITFGNNLPLADNFVSQLQQRYTDEQQPIELLNLGLGGYDTLQEVATLNSLGLKFSPDHVVLAYCINDIAIASGNLNYIKRLQHYGNSPFYRLRLAQFIRVQLDRIALKEFNKKANKRETFIETYQNYMAELGEDEILFSMQKNLKQQLDTQYKNNQQRYAFSRSYTDTLYIQRLRYALQWLKTLQNQHGFGVTVLIFPFLIEDEQSRSIYHNIYQIIEHEMNRLDFNTIQLYPEYKKIGLEQLKIKAIDGVHPNKQGHAIAAEELYRAIPLSN